MEFQLDNGKYQVVFSTSNLNIAIEESAPLNVIVGDTTKIDVGQVITYIKSGEEEINEAVQQGIASFDSNAQEKIDIFNAIVPDIEEDIDNLYKNKQDNLSSINAGTGISIVGSGANVLISNTQTSAEWGKITGDITNQEDLQQALNNAGTPDDLSIKKENNILQAVGLLDQNDTSKAISVWGGSREQYNEIEHKNENTLYYTTDDAGESVDVTREIELNNPFSLLDYKWSEYELNNASWLLSNGQFNSGATYISVYNLLLEIYNGTTTKEGVSVKLSTESFEDTDFVLNTDDTTFRLPIKVKLASGNAVVGNGITLGITDGTTNYLAIAKRSTNDLSLYSTGYGLEVGSSLTGSAAGHDNLSLGVTTDPTKSGLVLADNDMYLYFYVGETIQDANVIYASQVLTTIADCVRKSSATDRETVVSWGMPDYNSGISLAYNSFQGNGWVAPSNGIIIGSANWGGSGKYVIVNGSNTACGNTETSEFFLQVSGGDVVTQTNTGAIESSYTYLTFFPLKGAN